jgi:hypothetical protein
VDTVRPLAKAWAAVVFRLPMAKRAAGRAALPPARVAGTVAVRAGERVTLESVRVPTGTAPLPAALRVTAAPLLLRAPSRLQPQVILLLSPEVAKAACAALPTLT